MSRKMIQLTFSILLLAGMAFGFAMKDGALAQDNPTPKVETGLLEQLTKGSADFIIMMAKQADVSAADQLLTKAEKGHYVFDTLVATATRSQADIRSYLDSNGVDYQSFYIVNAIWIKQGSAALAEAISLRSDVATISINHQFKLDEPINRQPSTAQPQTVEPNLSFIKADDVWAMGINGEGTVMAGNDTGLDVTHPTIAPHYRGCLNPPTCSNMDHNYNWYDAFAPSNVVPWDDYGHGTHTTGTMVGDDGAGNQIGVAPGAKTVHCKNMVGGSGDSAHFILCFEWDLAPWDLSGANPLPAKAPDAVNNSWGFAGGGNNSMRVAVDNLQAAGILVEVSAGNEGTSGCQTLRSPGDYQEVLTTGSVNHASPYPGTITGFSSRGPSSLDGNYFPDIMAPGENIRSALPGNQYAYWGGTSMAGPHATALVGLIWSANPALRGQINSTMDIIQETAVPLTGQGGSNCGGDYAEGPNNDWGFGTIDAQAAVQLAIAMGGSGQLDGTVTDAVTGDPIENATVVAVHEDGFVWDDQTDAAGYYTMTVAAGTFDITASNLEYESATLSNVVVVTDTITTRDFELTPRGKLVGIVRDFDNLFPLVGATITVDDGSTTTTLDDGSYEILLDQGTYTVTASMQDYAPETAEVEIVSGLDTEQNFALKAAIVFTPSPLHVTVEMESTYNTGASILNRLPTDYEFEFQEKDDGYVPLLSGEQSEYELAPSIPGYVTTGIIPEGYIPNPVVSGRVPLGPWQGLASTPFDTMDNPYLEYSGMGYLVGGYGAGGQVGIYNPDSNSWTTGATEPAPQIAYPVDGCVGQNASGEGVAVLFNDTTSGATTLHRYNITTNTWDTPAVPAGFPSGGLWAANTVSVFSLTGENVCYISGGATTPGGGNTSTLYEYHPDTNTVVNLGAFNYLAGGFDFHAAWYVPWIGASGAICVGGGTNSSSSVSSGTQCYDINAGVFNPANADLGTLPSGLWGMASGILYEGGDYQLWVANGADAGFALWPNSAYFSETDRTWHAGPTPPTTVYRVGGTNIFSEEGCSFYVAAGSTGGFTPSNGHNRNFSSDCPPMRGADVPWLGEVPVNGTVPAGDTLPVSIYFTATQAVGINQPGDYMATLNVDGDPKVSVPVVMTVLPPDTWGKLAGTIKDKCTNQPIEEALVEIAGGDPITQTMTDEDGYYSAWIEQGTYDVSYSAPGYVDTNGEYDILPGQTTNGDVILIPDRPCIMVEPDLIEVWVLTDTQVYTSGGLQISNPGYQPLTWEVNEKDEGYVPLGLNHFTTVTIPAGPEVAPAGSAVASGPYQPSPSIEINIPNLPSAGGPRVLLVCSDDPPLCEPIRAQLQAFGDLEVVDAFDARTGTPTLSELEAYDVVLTWTNYVYADPVGMGNVLADYVDAGGKVINLMFAMGTHGWQMGGRFMTEGYTAMNGTSLSFATICLGAYDPTHPIMAGVTNVCEYYRMLGTYLTTDSSTVASWNDGQLFVATKDNRTVVSVNGYVGSARQWTGQMDLMVHNAILWLMGPTDVPWIWETPITGTVSAGSTDDIEIFFTSQYTDGTPMPFGTYSATLTIDNNDPVAGAQEIPVIMHIVEAYVTPEANFTWTTVLVGTPTVFTNTTVPGIPGDTTFEWDFGDGTTQSGTWEPKLHIYATFGTYEVSLTACNANGCDTATSLVKVLPKVILLPLVNKN